jgi:hypothetical protein
MPQSVHNGQLIATRHTSQGLGRVKTYRPRETGDAKLNLACYRNCELESTWFALSAVSDLVAPMRMPMRTPHVWITAMSGFTPPARAAGNLSSRRVVSWQSPRVRRPAMAAGLRSFRS